MIQEIVYQVKFVFSWVSSILYLQPTRAMRVGKKYAEDQMLAF